MNVMAPAALGRDLARLTEAVTARFAAGDGPGGIALALAAQQRTPSPELERMLVAWRMQAFQATPRGTGRPDWPPSYPDPFPDCAGLPSIEASALTPQILGGAILHHGALWVRGLASEATAEGLRQDIERAFAAQAEFFATGGGVAPSPWYTRAPVHSQIADARKFLEEGGGVWSADSPRMLAQLLDMFETSGATRVIGAHLGERPALSVGKSTLRRVPVDTGTDWHQDGSFLGSYVRTVNLWLALSHCGVDAAGLDVVARRLPYVVQSGSHGAVFDWAVGPELVDMLTEGGATIASPVFAPGDALLFDQLMLHRTGARPNLTKPRWAVETWFFAPSAFPTEQGGLLI